MTAMTSTAEVTAARILHGNGMETRLYTATCTASDTFDLTETFELIYEVRIWDEADGTDGEGFAVGGGYAATVGNTQNKGDVLIEVTGRAVDSVGGAT